jgi:dTDP-4-amino-4,6-dideoxygalactose transaminase
VDRNRDRILEIINKKGIGASIYYKTPIHKTRFYSRLDPITNLPNTSWAADHVISLPVHPDLTDNEIGSIANAVKKAVDSS